MITATVGLVTGRGAVQDIQIKHNKEVSDLKEEVEKIKERVSKTEPKIDILTKQCQKKNETQVEDIVKIVVHMLNNQKNHATSSKPLKEDTNLIIVTSASSTARRT